jgi:hypothetical protein
VVKCPDGSKKVVYKNLDDAFPLIIKDWYTNWEVVIDFLKGLDAGVRAEVGKQLSGQMFELDSHNKSMQMSFRAAYVLYIADPCANHERFAKTVKNIIETDGRLREKALEIDNLKARTGDVRSLISSIQALQMKKMNEKNALSGLFRKAHENVKVWTEG